MSDIYANVPETPETLQARINEVYEAMLIIEQSGASPELTAAIVAMGERDKALRAQLRDMEQAHVAKIRGDLLPHEVFTGQGYPEE